MKAIMLCAGYATRLYPLTENQPKPLLPINDRPILEWILETLADLRELNRIFIVANHKFAGHFEKWAAQTRYPWPIEVVDDQTTTNENRLGAIGDLNYTLKTKKVPFEDLLVIAGDNFFDFDLRAFVDQSVTKRPNAVIATYDIGDKVLAKQYGIVRTDANGQVVEFLEKPANPPTTQASCGLYWLSAESRVLLDRYLAESHNADQPGHYMRWLAEQKRLFAVPLKGHWFDIGDLASYQKANALSLEFVKSREKKGLK